MKNGTADALQRAKDLIGTEAALAAVVGVTQPHINYMLKKKKQVPAEWCPKIEAATEGKVTKHQLRSDLWPEDERAA